MSALNKLTSANEKFKELNALKKSYRSEFKQLLFNAAQDLFNENPELNSIVWSQEFPSFNDGDPCYFSLYGVYFYKDPTVDEDRANTDYDFCGRFYGEGFNMIESNLKTHNMGTFHTFINNNETLMEHYFFANSQVYLNRGDTEFTILECDGY